MHLTSALLLNVKCERERERETERERERGRQAGRQAGRKGEMSLGDVFEIPAPFDLILQNVERERGGGYS